MATMGTPVVKRDRAVDTFLALLTIDSPSGEEAAVAKFVAERLRRLGLEPTIDPAGNLLARGEGEGEPLLLNAHLDNVPPCRGVKPVWEDDLLRSDGTTVLGADDKSGVAAILEVLAVLKEGRLRHRPLEVVFTVREEQGLLGAKALDFGWFRAREGLVVDGGGPISYVWTGAPSQNSFEATIHGRPAHAGVEPEKGINAIRAAAEAIAAMPLGRIDAITTANIGIIEGGRARNIVPDHCRIVGEARSHDPERLQRQTDLMVEALEGAVKRHEARLDLAISSAYEAFLVGPTAPVLQRVMAAGQAMGLQVETRSSGGGSDANIFNQHAITSVILGTGYEDPHTTSERIRISDFIQGTELLLRSVVEAR